MSKTGSLSSVIKKLILDNGFDLVGISAPEIKASSREHMNRWVDNGYFADMQYMKDSISERMDPASILEGAKSVIVVGVNYFNGECSQLVDEGYGKVARYAWGKDYHAVLNEKLEELVAVISGTIAMEFKYKITVDTSPVPEKLLAYQAGLGFIGKNSLLISPQFGSWIFLGCIFSDMPLTPDSPLEDIPCGDCSKCIEACPTDALNEEYMLNACKCISALTIENRGAIDEEIMNKIDNRMFGCDMCQDVCPFNQKTVETGWEEFMPGTAAAGFVYTQDILSLKSNNEFKQDFLTSPLLRATRWGLMRNACIVSVNRRLKENLPLIEDLAESETAPEWLKDTARWAFHKLT